VALNAGTPPGFLTLMTGTTPLVNVPLDNPVGAPAGKVLTVNPGSSLGAATKYIVAVTGVVDIYGQELAAVGKDFTTA